MKKTLLIILCCICLVGCDDTSKKEKADDTSLKSKIENIETIKNICVVTEDNDPNNQLNKKGGYIESVYFAIDEIDQSLYEGNDSCEKGTDSGGSIEIYSNESDAKKRNEYLSNFDGGMFSNYHTQDDNIVIRLSNELSASKQDKLTSKILKQIKGTN